MRSARAPLAAWIGATSQHGYRPLTASGRGAGTPAGSSTGKLTATELIIESGLRRDVVYEHNGTTKW